MRQVCVKPISFKYYHNSKTYYLNGIVLDPIVEENVIVIAKGSTIQLLFDSEALGTIHLADAKELIFFVESLAQDVYSRGRRILRFTTTRINEDDKWGSD